MGIVAACVWLLVVSGCHMPGTSSKLFYVNSFHPGEASSDEIMAGIYEVVADSRARLDVFFMDAQRFPEPASIEAKTEEVLRVIRQIQPDVIIASHDIAAKFILAEPMKDGSIPCVICGVDWTHTPLDDLPTENVTVMVGDAAVAAAPREQGRWAARAALRIVRGKSPAESGRQGR